jgi:protein TonB
MRWSMLPVSVAVHAAVLFVFLINPIAASLEMPAPWPLSSPAYVAVKATPPPLPVERRAAAVRSTAVAPISPPGHIANDPVVHETTPVVEGGLPAGFGSSVAPGRLGPSIDMTPLPPPPPPAAEKPKLFRVGGDIREPRKLVHVPAEYPEIARRARVEGLVIIEAMIDERGFVRDARVLRSVPLLDAAALAAATQWRYTPTLLNGVPVRVLMSITFNFKLTDHAP